VQWRARFSRILPRTNHVQYSLIESVTSFRNIYFSASKFGLKSSRLKGRMLKPILTQHTNKALRNPAVSAADDNRHIQAAKHTFSDRLCSSALQHVHRNDCDISLRQLSLAVQEKRVSDFNFMPASVLAFVQPSRNILRDIANIATKHLPAMLVHIPPVRGSCATVNRNSVPSPWNPLRLST
jgi:hypothetical protein